MGASTPLGGEALERTGMRISSIIFVGQGPSKDGDPYAPLEGRIGERIGELLGITNFPESFSRINLNSEWIGKAGGKGDIFDRTEGIRTASVLLRGSWTRYVLLGKVVAECFNVTQAGSPPVFLSTVTHGVKSFFLLPHPSGINRWWNNPENVQKAKETLSEFVYAPNSRVSKGI